MIINIKHEMIVFWAAFLAGQLICLIFDFFRSMRKVSEPSRLSVAIQDVIFCIISFRLFFGILYLTDNGAIRWYSLAAALLGAVLYFCIESRFAIKMYMAFFSVLAKIFSPLVRLYRFSKKHLRRLFDSAKAQISPKLAEIRQFHTKNSAKPHENSDAI